ncbi:MAG: fumarate/nitrate reduction transcriptional regulator Fnr [Burkholderiales bacterium]|nr:fumarate/nitrate reduction transcriptional regulator Fnr [Burkholderiales bacterium]
MNTIACRQVCVYLVEDSALVRERMVALIGECEDLRVVGSASTARTAVEGILRERPDTVLLDVRLAGGTGLDVVRQVRPLAPGIAFVVYTNEPNGPYRRLLLAAGVHCVLDKNTEFANLREALIASTVSKPGAPVSHPVALKEQEMLNTATLRSLNLTGRTRMEASPANGAGLARVPTRCSTCNLRELCLPCGLTGRDAERAEELVFTRKRVRRGESLYRAGDSFGSLYSVRSGFFKTTLVLEDGREQVTGFLMAGEIMGMDGIGTESHSCNAIALEDSEVCVIPYSRLQALTRDVPELQHQFHKVMSREIVREHGVMLLLGSMRAEERLAAFLLNLSQRFTARGYSQTEFNLRMTREEIGSYLGLKLETVSRAFSKFQEEDLISVQQKHIRILDVEGVKRTVAQKLS